MLDKIRVGLQKKFDEEDQHNSALYGFPTDNLLLPPQRFSEITAVLADAFVPHAHARMEELFSVFMVSGGVKELDGAEV